MKYMLLDPPGRRTHAPSTEAWATLSEDEQQAVYADYKAINETPGVTPGLRLDSRPRRRRPCACRTARR